MNELEIEQLLEEVITILNQYRVSHWASQFERLRSEFNSARQSGDGQKLKEALENILNVYGGMGSFGDIYITYKAGFPIAAEDVSRVNNEFQNLRTRLYVTVRDENAKLQSK